MSLNANQILRNMDFVWMSLNGIRCNCKQIIHPGLTCLQQFLLKFKDTLKTVSKFYIIFHLIPYILKVKKLIQEKRLFKGSMKAFLNFIGSLCFMLHLVCGLKFSLCLHCNMGWDIDGKTFFWGGFPTAVSILWESSSRRQQIAYYAFVRSLRGVYMYLKRRDIVKVNLQSEYIIPIFFGILFYVFTENHHNLKYLNIFQGLWGKI